MVDLINANGSINFSVAAGGDNELTAQELVTALRAEGKSDAEIKTMMQNIEINVDTADGAVTFDLDDATDIGVLDFDRLTITDTDETATHFEIFIADTDGLILNTNTVGKARADGSSNIGSVKVEDTDSAGITYVNNALSVILDETGWESLQNNDTSQYELIYKIDNSVTLIGAVSGFDNTISVSGDLDFIQADGDHNDGIINIKIDVSSTVASDLIYDVNITDTVSTLDDNNLGNLAGGVEVHVYQDANIKNTMGNISVDTDTTIGRETTRRAAYGYQLQNWVDQRAEDAEKKSIIYDGKPYDEDWIKGMAAAMLDDTKTEYLGINIAKFVTDLKDEKVAISKKAPDGSSSTNPAAPTTTYTFDAKDWQIGKAAGLWHGFKISTDPTKSNEKNSGGTFYLPPEIYNQLKATHSTIFGALGAGNVSSGSYSNYGNGSIANLKVEWPAGSGTQVKVMDLIAGGGTIKTETDNRVDANGITTGKVDDFELLLGDIKLGSIAYGDKLDAVCRNCDPVAMIIFEQASGDLSNLKATTENSIELLGRDYSKRAVGDASLAQKYNVEIQTGVFMGGLESAGTGVEGVTDGPTAYINQGIYRPDSGQVYNVTGKVGDEATYVDGYTSITGQVVDDQIHTRVYTGEVRISNEFRDFLNQHLGLLITMMDTDTSEVGDMTDVPTIAEFLSGNAPSSYYNDDLAAFFLSHPDEKINPSLFNRMLTAYADGQISVENFAPLINVDNTQDMFQIFMNLGIAESGDINPKIVDLFDNMNESSLMLGIETLLEYVGAEAVASIYYQVGNETAFNNALSIYFQNEGPRSQELADALVTYLNGNDSKDNCNRFSGLIWSNELEETGMGYIANAFEHDWEQSVFTEVAFNLMGRTTLEASDFRKLNMLLTNIEDVNASDFYNSLIAKAGDDSAEDQDLVQSYLREAVIAASRGVINPTNSILGMIQSKIILFAVGQNLDGNLGVNKGNLELFGFNVTNEGSFVDDIIFAAENLYQVAKDENNLALQNELVDTILTGLIGFDLDADAGDAQYFNNIKRIAAISEGSSVAGSLLHAVARAPSMSGYLRANTNIMNNSVSKELNSLVGITSFVGVNGKGGYYINFVDLSLSGLNLSDILDSGGSTYAATNATSAKALRILGGDRSGIQLEMSQDISDWIFTNTQNLSGEVVPTPLAGADGKPKVVGGDEDLANLSLALEGQTDANEIATLYDEYIASNNITLSSEAATALQELKTETLLPGNIFLNSQIIMGYLDSL
ncbi:MAG: hypothetical protein PHF25_00025 [Candidatus Margulisbacteria bacterium]|nr:hypothetical protein [Candidatus Margulisiibacteriota bacterium]